MRDARQNFVERSGHCIDLVEKDAQSLVTVFNRLSSRMFASRHAHRQVDPSLFAVGCVRGIAHHTDNRLNCDTIYYEENIPFALGADPARTSPGVSPWVIEYTWGKVQDLQLIGSIWASF